MKHIPNLITSVRLFSALALLFLTLFTSKASLYFLPLFIAAGVSDMLDGYIARRFNCCTEFGAHLDSISDLSLYVAAATFLLLTMGRELTPCLPFIIMGTCTQTFHIWYSTQRFKTFPAYHSDFSRLSAYIIFFLVILFRHTNNPALISAVALIWTACSAEGIIITTLLKRARTNLAGIHTVYSAMALKRALLGWLRFSRLWFQLWSGPREKV
jgi:CDP-diacylglycerol---glycerol-3-phosphate 3-phosphatidyltransferase